MKKYLIFILVLISQFARSQPKPGDYFKEYSWATPLPSKPGQELYVRVCGDGFYDDAVRKGEHLFNEGFVKDGWFSLPDNIDLTNVEKIEVQVERMLCHDGSTGLAVKFNEGQWKEFPKAAAIPEPQEEYLYHYYPTVSLPITDFKAGVNNNKFRFKVNKYQRWGMPQNMVYGMVIRVYHKQMNKIIPPTIEGIKTGDIIGDSVTLNIKGTNVAAVEYIAQMEDYNYEGDGVYNQWHYNYYRGQITNHIGTTAGSFLWNTDWVPDQENGFKIAARVKDKNGFYYFTQPVENLTFKRSFKIELCKPYSQPRRWATREMEFGTSFDIKGDPKKVENMQISSVTWSPGYMNGLYVNDYLIMDREACKYCYHIIKKTVDHPAVLSTMNGIKTGKTPLYGGKMTHGTEIQYPGFMVKVKYKN